MNGATDRLFIGGVEIGTSQRRYTEVRLTHRWRELDSNFRFRAPRGLASTDMGRSTLDAGVSSSSRQPRQTDRDAGRPFDGSPLTGESGGVGKGGAVGDANASRNRKFESIPLQRGVCELSPRSPRRGCDAARPRSRGWREPSEALPPVGTQERGLSPNAPATARA